jgi:hypothetical protein
MLIPWQSHDDIYVCSPDLAMSGVDEMDSIPECVLSATRGFLLLRPVMPGASDQRYLRPEAGDAYLLMEVPEHV